MFRGVGDACGLGPIACAACNDGGCVGSGLCDRVMMVVVMCVLRKRAGADR